MLYIRSVISKIFHQMLSIITGVSKSNDTQSWQTDNRVFC